MKQRTRIIARPKTGVRKRLNVKRQTNKNTKQIAKLNRAALPYCPFFRVAAETISTSIHTHMLTSPNTWTRCFRTYDVAGIDIPRQYFMRSLDLNWYAQCEVASVGNLFLQVFVVSLVQRTAKQILDRTTRLSNLTQNLDYIHSYAGSAEPLSDNGDVLYKLNPAFYRVHYNSGLRRIGQSTTSADTAVTNIRDSTTMGKCHIKWKKPFKQDQAAQTNGFLALNSVQVEPQCQLYLVIMSNTGEAAPGTGELFTSWRADIHGNCNLPE